MTKSKLLFIPLDYHVSAQQDLFNAFCEGYDTMYYTTLHQAIGFMPEYIYVQSGAIKAERLLALKQKTGAFIFQWTGDCRDWVLPEVIDYKDICDATFLACGLSQKDMYEKILGHPVFYLQHGVSPWNFKNVQCELSNKKTVFIGNAYNQFSGAVERNELCKFLSSKLNTFEVIGSGFNLPYYNNHRTIPFNDTFDIYNNSYIGVSSSIYNDKAGYWSNRMMDIMASGTCCLTRYVPFMDKLYNDMEHCVFFNTHDEAFEKIEMLMSNPELRNRIALNGQEHVKKFHTLSYRVKEMTDELLKLKK